MRWICRDRILELREPPFPVRIMGILNITPDSFSDGGKYADPDMALLRLLELTRDGADIVDIGGQSTRPGCVPVDAGEEWGRIAPLLERLAELRANDERLPVISVDTFLPEVAERALSAGAHIINDVTGLENPAMREVIARHSASCVLMHCADITAAADPPGEVRGFFERLVERCAHDGITPEHICLDCGIGFGKTRAQEAQLLARMGECRTAGRPLLAAASRKRIIAWLTGLDVPPEERDTATHHAHLAAALAGADVVRVHDVPGASRTLMLAKDDLLRRT